MTVRPVVVKLQRELQTVDEKRLVWKAPPTLLSMPHPPMHIRLASRPLNTIFRRRWGGQYWLPVARKHTREAGLLTRNCLDQWQDERVLVVVRPPPESSAYHHHNPIYERLLDKLVAEPSAISVLIPRTEGQRERAVRRREPSLIVPERAIDAQSLIAY